MSTPSALLLSPTFTIKFDDRTRLTALMYYQYDKVTGGDGGYLPVYGTLLPNPNGRISRSTNLDSPADVFERDQYAIGYEFVHEFSPDLKFTSNTKYSHYDERTPVGIYDSGGLTNTTDPTMPGYYSECPAVELHLRRTGRQHRNRQPFRSDGRHWAGAQQALGRRGLSSGPQRCRLRLRLRHRDDQRLCAELSQLSPRRRYGYPTRYNHQTIDQTGVYFQDQIKFGQLFLLGGGRYDWVDSRYLGAFSATNTPTTTSSQSESKFTYRVGLTYVTSAGFAPYLSYSRSFEPQIGEDGVTLQPFKPSEGRQIEGGVKYDARGLPSDIKLFVTVAGFDIRQSNVVSTVPSVSPVFGTASGEVEVYGGEESRSWAGSTSSSPSTRPTATTIRRSCRATRRLEVGQPLPTTPENKFSIFGDYTLRKGTFAGLGGGAGLRYTQGSAGSLPGAFNPVVYDGQGSTLVDAIVHYDFPGWRFAVNASNLLDKTYVARCSGANGCFYGAGRQVIGTITKRF